MHSAIDFKLQVKKIMNIVIFILMILMFSRRHEKILMISISLSKLKIGVRLIPLLFSTLSQIMRVAGPALVSSKIDQGALE